MAGSSSSSFLDSMTFLDREMVRCDCDECDNSVPPSIRDAVRQRKRQRLELGPIKRTQDRTLVCRYSSANDNINISVWKLTMPMDADPRIEFGTSHRLVWIQRLPTTNDNGHHNHNQTTAVTLRSIGKGIIGSSDEEKSRFDLEDWREGHVILVPSNGGKAVGWLHTTTSTVSGAVTDAQKTAVGLGPAVLYVAKIPVDFHIIYDIQDSKQNNNSDTHTDNDANWVKELLRHCHIGLETLHVANVEEHRTIKPMSQSQPYYIFPNAASQVLKSAFREAMNSTLGDAAQTDAEIMTSGNRARNSRNNKPDIPAPVDAAITKDQF
jgi:hypothetical protein